MELILIRHAKTEKRQEGLPDMERHLTEKGIEKFTELVPELEKRLSSTKKKNIVTWSSPANRAMETADIVVEDLGLKAPVIHEFIYTGDLEEFAKAIQDVADDATLLVFGHQPTLSEWVEEFSGKIVRMKKGSMISLTLSKKKPIKGKVNWKIKP